MKTIHTLALTTLATAMAAGTAFAQQPTTPPTDVPQTQQMQPQTQHGQPHAEMDARRHDSSDKPSYDQLDARGDGRVTRADLAAHPRLLEKFDDIDTAGDGAISRAEYDAWKSQKRDRDQATPQY